jgi:molybdate/tungstate transport system substrate-binding protein
MTYRPSGVGPAQRFYRKTLTVATALATACASPDARTVRDSAMAVDSGDTAPRRLASDATLSLVTAARLTAPLRAAADSFGVAEAVTVRQAPETTGLRDLGTVDIAVLPAELFAHRLMPERTSWYVRFARDRVVLAYTDSSRSAATIDSTNWWKVLQRRGVRVGRVDPAAPAGYRALLVMELAASHYEQPKLAAMLRQISRGSTVRPNEGALVASLQSRQLDYIWTHESTARAANLRYVRLPPAIDLGEVGDTARYAAAEVVVPVFAADRTRQGATPDTAHDLDKRSTTDTVRVRGAPIIYGISILNDAPSPRHAERFLRFLFSDDGRRVLEAAHLDVLPRPTSVGTDVPPPIRAALGDVAMPVVPTTDSTRDTATIRPKQP